MSEATLDERIENFRSKISKKSSEVNNLVINKSVLEKKIEDLLNNELKLTKELILNRKASLLLNKTSEETKKSIIGSLEAIVSSALNIVYGEGHRFKIVMETRRNQPEVDYYIDDGNTEIQLKKPFIGKGGGKITVAAFALQLAVVEYADITGPLFLDEVTRYVDSEAVKRVALLIRDYAESNNRQIINITHHDEVAENSDIKIRVSKDKDGKAIIKIY